MQRLFIVFSILYSCVAWTAKPSYQIDLIVFANQANLNTELPLDIPIIPTTPNAISLKSDSEKTAKPYLLLDNSFSSLKDEYYQLSHRSNYQVLGHYSWRQPANNSSRVALPLVERNGWQMQGTLRVKQSSYYSFDAELQLSPPNNPQSSFTVSQKQRLKENTVYYLDNAHIGMVIKIYPIG